jgi:hypothetical protein
LTRAEEGLTRRRDSKLKSLLRRLTPIIIDFLSSPLTDMTTAAAERKVNLTFPLSLSSLPVELSQLCKGQFPPQMHREIDGAVIISKNEKNLDCSVTFVAEYVTQKFLIRFDEFHMECGDQLNIYDSSTAVGNARVRDTYYNRIKSTHFLFIRYML